VTRNESDGVLPVSAKEFKSTHEWNRDALLEEVAMRTTQSVKF
jgi:hypothetical protein